MLWFKHANTRKHVSKHSWLSSWVILNILAHLAHLAQSYFSLIFSATNTYNCFQFEQINKNSCSDKSLMKSEQRLQLFSSRRQPPLLVTTSQRYSLFSHIATITSFWSFILIMRWIEEQRQSDVYHNNNNASCRNIISAGWNI